MNYKITYVLFSTKKERIDRTRLSKKGVGYWDGERGNSTYLPDCSKLEIIKMLARYNLKGITYQEGIPDFTPCALILIEVHKMSIFRKINFKLYDEICAEIWNKQKFLNRNDWTSRMVEKYRKSHHLTWHELNDRISCQLVPREIHAFFTHLGGIAECKRAEKALKSSD